MTALPEGGDCYFVATATNLVGVTSVLSNEAIKFIVASSLAIPGQVVDTQITWQESTGPPTVTGFSTIEDSHYNGDPITANKSADQAGNLFLFAVNERAGTGHAAHTVSDDGPNDTWVKIIGEDQELGDPQARHSFSVWMKITDSSDSTTRAITVDDGTTNTKEAHFLHIEPDAAYGFVLADAVSAGTGTGSSSPLGTGSTAAPGQADAFVIAFGAWRTSSDTPTSKALSNTDSALLTFDRGNNNRELADAYLISGQDDTAKSSDLSWGGTGNEAIAAIAVFTDTAAVAALIEPPLLRSFAVTRAANY